MPRIEISRRFAQDLMQVQSKRVEGSIYSALESIQLFGGLGSPNIPESIQREFGDGIRKVAVNPFDIIYSYYPEKDLVRIEALVHRKAVS